MLFRSKADIFELRPSDARTLGAFVAGTEYGNSWVEYKFWRATLGFVLLGFPFKISDEPLRHSYIWRPSLKADITDS